MTLSEAYKEHEGGYSRSVHSVDGDASLYQLVADFFVERTSTVELQERSVIRTLAVGAYGTYDTLRLLKNFNGTWNLCPVL